MNIGAMPATVLFISHEVQLEWYGWIAAELRRRHGVRTVLWTLGERDRQTALRSQTFDEVVDLLAGFDRFSPDILRQQERNLEALLAFEHRVGTTCFHEDAILDRGITGFTDAEVDFHTIHCRWTPQQIAALAIHLLGAMEARLAAAPVLFAVGEYNSLPYRLAHRLLRSCEIPHLCPIVVPHAGEHVYFADALDWEWPQCRDLYREFLEGGIPAHLRPIAEQLLDSVARKVKPTYFVRSRRGPRGWTQRLHPQRVWRGLRDWRWARSFQSRSNPRSLPPELLSPRGRAARAFDVRRRKQNYERVAQHAVPAQPYASYFLHEQPEYTVEGLAFEYQDQVAFVRNLVACLPADMLLAVKEHRPQAGRRPLSFYGELVSIPNVVLLHDTLDSQDVIARARLAVTLTGTVAMESVCAGVPCVVFGNVHYEYFRGVYKAAGFQHLRQLLRDSGQVRGATREEALAALAARHAASQEAPYPPADASDAAKFTDALENECRRRGIALPAQGASGRAQEAGSPG